MIYHATYYYYLHLCSVDNGKQRKTLPVKENSTQLKSIY